VLGKLREEWKPHKMGSLNQEGSVKELIQVAQKRQSSANMESTPLQLMTHLSPNRSHGLAAYKKKKACSDSIKNQFESLLDVIARD